MLDLPRQNRLQIVHHHVRRKKKKKKKQARWRATEIPTSKINQKGLGMRITMRRMLYQTAGSKAFIALPGERTDRSYRNGSVQASPNFPSIFSLSLSYEKIISFSFFLSLTSFYGLGKVENLREFSLTNPSLMLLSDFASFVRRN